MTGRFEKTVDEWLLSCYVEDCTPATIETYAKMLRWFREYLETLDPVPLCHEISTRDISGVHQMAWCGSQDGQGTLRGDLHVL